MKEDAKSEKIPGGKGARTAPRFGIDHASGQLVLGSLRIPMPKSRAARISIGTGLMFGGFLGFLPILGFWMVPLGLLVLSHDLPAARRRRRRLAVWWGKKRRPLGR